MKRMVAGILVIVLLALNLPGIAETGDRLVRLPSSLTEVQESAFENDAAMKRVVIPESVETIGALAFANCANLTEVTFEGDEVVIADNAFSGSSVSFVASQNSAAEQFALAHGIPVTVKNSKDSFGDMAMDMILQKGMPDSGLKGEIFASERLMVQASGNVLPDISQFQPVRVLSEGTGFFLIQFSSTTQASECYDYLNDISGIEAEPDLFLTAIYQPDDGVSAASLNDNWTDKDPMGFEVYSEYIQRKYPGASATVAVIDSGIANHSALNAYVGQGYDFTGQNNPRYDAKDHGTGVAGCIVDSMHGADVEIIPIRLFSDQFLTASMVRQAVKKAIDIQPDVINLSASFSQESGIIRNMMERTDIPIVVAAGNEGANCDQKFPAGLTSDNVITVSGIDTNMTRDLESNYGSSVDFCAPSTNITSYRASGGTFSAFHGTSYAAPQISAAIALLSMDPERDLSDLRDVCVDLGSQGKDSYYGYGLPDLSMFGDKVRDISITNELPATMEVGGTSVLMYDVLPASAENKTVLVSSSDENVLNVTKTADGVLRIVALSQGTANVTITAQDGSGVSVTTADITVIQPVSRISITAATNTVNLAIENSTLGLTAIVMPSDATNKDVVWSSLDETIATVAQNGVVTPVAEGRVVIRATAADGKGAYGEFEVSVIYQPMPEAIGIDLGDGDALMEVGEEIQLKALIEPAEAVQTVSWYSTEPNVLEVAKNGTITAMAPGRATIIVTSTVDSNMQCHENFTVRQSPTALEIEVEEGSDGVIDVGSSLQFTATVLPVNSYDSSVTWSSSDETVATVDPTGRVSGVASGSAVISVQSNVNSALKKSFAITVRQLPLQLSIEGDNFVFVDATKQLTAVVLPENADDPTVEWSSSDENIATVTQSGQVTGRANGVVTITVRSNAVPELTYAHSMEVYPEWSYYDWTPVDQVPENAIVTDRKWTYTETTQQSTSTLSGWNLTSEEWKTTYSGTGYWVDFSQIPGFNSSHPLFAKYNVAPPVDSLTSTNKRVVHAEGVASYLYWHWMYDCGQSNAYDRIIYYQPGWAYSMNYQYFGAFESATAYSQTGANQNQGSGHPWYYVGDSAYQSYGVSQGSYYWYRNNIYFRNYTDYVKVYNFSRECEVFTEPVASANITNVKAYVKYKVPNSSSIQISGWVPETQVPIGAEILESKWTYKETTTSTSTSIEGWNQESSTWVKTADGSVRWVNFAPLTGFNQSNGYYLEFNKPAPVPFENMTAKRVINSEVNDGYLYWHWMYNCNSSNAAGRAIFYQYGTGSEYLTGNNYGYKYFGAFESPNNYAQVNAGSNWGQNDAYYLWYYVNDRSSYADTQGSYWWYRTQIKRTNYTDYHKVYTYSRTRETMTEPTAGATVSDIAKLVRYIVK